MWIYAIPHRSGSIDSEVIVTCVPSVSVPVVGAGRHGDLARHGLCSSGDGQRDVLLPSRSDARFADRL